MVQLFCTASELHKLKVPGLPGTSRGIKLRADGEKWPFRTRKGRGGGVEYPVLVEEGERSVLTSEQQAHVRAVLEELETADATAPGATQDSQDDAAHSAGRAEGARLALARRLEEERDHLTRAAGLSGVMILSDAAKLRMDAKAEALRRWQAFWSERPALPLVASQHVFAAAYNAGELVVPDWMREALPTLSQASLQRWRSELSKEGLARLAGNYGKRKGTGRIDAQPQVRNFILGMMADSAHCRGTHVLKALQARFGDDDQVELPSLRSIERWMADWKRNNAQTFTAVTNPDEWKNRYMAAFGSASAGVSALNQLWEMDSTPADVMLSDGRHSIVGVIDVYSRRTILLVTKTSKSTAVAAVIRRALIGWGVPDVIKTDNGKDYTSRHITRVLDGLEVTQDLCPPFQPWKKPHIERFFGTFTRDLVELLRGFIGHSVAERKAIEARKSFADRLMQRGEVVEIAMTAAELQEFCDRWVADIYHHQPHEGLSGRAPFEVASSWREHIRRIPNERALDLLLAEAPGDGGKRVVQKKGVQLDGTWFIAAELEAYIGQTVQVLYDERDFGRVFVYGVDGFVCIAECPERTGISREEVASRARELQKKRVQEERKALKDAAKEVRVDDIVTDILADRARKAGKLMAFPAPEVEHESEGLRRAASAAQALEALSTAPAPHDAEDLEMGRKLIAQFEEERQRLLDVEEPLDRYKRLSKRLEGGGSITRDEERFMRNYETTPEYRGWLLVQPRAEDQQ